MGACTEAVSIESDVPSRSWKRDESESGARTRGDERSPIVDKLFGAESLAVPHLKAPVLQRAQRTYGNRASQQWAMRAGVLQRHCSCGGTCSKCREEEKRAVQRFEGIPSSSGAALDPAVRRPLEAHFGADLTDIRVHTGSDAAKSAQNLDALAYTSGRDIYFAQGMYAPSSGSGQRLLAHEVAHVVQQSAGKEPAFAAKSSSGLKIGAPDDSLEEEAEKKADEFVGNPVAEEEERKKLAASGTVQKFIQRQPDAGVHASQISAPREKSAPDVEAMYRRAGLVEAANAVAKCREGNCSLSLTEAEAYQAYRNGRVTAGMGEPAAEEQRRSPSSPGLASAGMIAGAVALPAVETATSAAGKTALERAALRWGAAEVIEGGTAAAAAPATAAATVAIPVALGVYLVVATVDLVGYTKFQTALQRQGYVILPNPLQVCISGCHQPAAPTYKPFDSKLLPGSVSPFGPSGVSEADREALRRWIEAEPKGPGDTKTAPAPQPVPGTDATTPTAAGPSATRKPGPVMDPNLTEAQKRKWEHCHELHEQYKKVQAEEAGYGENLKRLRLILESGKATAGERMAYCVLLRLRIDLVKRLLKERMDYLNDFCDEFDWFQRGTTPKQRLDQHWGEVQNVTANLNQLEAYLRRFCP